MFVSVHGWFIRFAFEFESHYLWSLSLFLASIASSICLQSKCLGSEQNILRKENLKYFPWITIKAIKLKMKKILIQNECSFSLSLIPNCRAQPFCYYTTLQLSPWDLFPLLHISYRSSRIHTVVYTVVTNWNKHTYGGKERHYFVLCGAVAFHHISELLLFSVWWNSHKTLQYLLLALQVGCLVLWISDQKVFRFILNILKSLSSYESIKLITRCGHIQKHIVTVLVWVTFVE